MKSKFGFRNKASENHWQPCSIENLSISRPLVICLSGNGTKTETEANGFCKLAENLLGDKSKEVDLMGVVYGDKNSSEASVGELSNSEIESLVDNILLPLCKDKQTKQLLSLEDCCKNLSLITFFTFCHGNSEVSKILKNFNEKLETMGLHVEDRKTLTQSLFEVNYAKETDLVSCPQINIASAQDSIGSMFGYWYFGNDDYENKFNGHYAMVCDKPGQFCKKDWPRPEAKPYGSITIIANSILKEDLDKDSFAMQSEEHNIGYFKKDKNGFNTLLNEEGKVLREAMSLSLQKRIDNSILNQKNNTYKRFYLQELNSYLENSLPRNNRISNIIENNLCM